ncbi:chemotaxis protein [Bacterioplanes sanyensis]|uniref:Chemotaxis protein n=1 Tax=Bacterioplanes sanyensis TaxID=1249553 RepID=A0A222FLH5_9GAMM|nr:methyl-accepting chemotaxis protein [Bacterioplanes sanyensis]ASP39231.1 chemotaxis protein [Bacterioplanes sanyensis]
MKAWPLKTKLLAVTLAIVVTLTLAMGWQTFSGISDISERLSRHAGDNLKTAVVRQLQSSARGYGADVSGYINAAYRVPLTVANILSHSIEAGPAQRLSREQVNRLLSATLEQHQDISSAYAQFEANGYDDEDRFWLGSSDMHTVAVNGALEIYLIRNRQGQIEQQRVEESDSKYLSNRNEFGIREAEWYLCGKDSGKPCLMEPYMYEISPGYNELMTSLTVPVMAEGRFRGIVGVDANLPLFQHITEELSTALYDGAAKVTLLSHIGLVAASSHYQEHLARPLNEAMPELGAELMELHTSGGQLETDDRYFVSAAIPIKASGNTWALLIELPKAVALAELTELQTLIEDEHAVVISQQILAAVILAILAIFTMAVVVRSIVQPLKRLNHQVNQLASADGDLTQSLELDTHAELIELSQGFNRFIVKLKNLVDSLKAVSTEVRQQSQENLNISGRTRSSTDEQQHEINNVVTATQEMSATAHEVSRIANDVSSRAQDIHTSVTDSQQNLSTALNSVLEMTDGMTSASQSISKVAQHSEDINRILEVIRSIAEQTNLLALNAAIEAARAGEQGRGFAVVADEVRTLASRTQESTAEIDGMIETLQKEVHSAVSIIQQGSEQSSQSMDATQHAHESLHQVVAAIGEIADHIGQVATAAEEQSSVSEEITRNLTVIGDAANILAELAQDANHSSVQVTQQLDILDQRLAGLRT